MSGLSDSFIAGGGTKRAPRLLCNYTSVTLGMTRSANAPESAQ